MADRITKERLGSALSFYLDACKSAGYTDEQLNGACIADCYQGGIWHVCRHIERGKYAHDLPGFHSSDRGRISKREVYTALHLAARVLFDLSDAKQAVR